MVNGENHINTIYIRTDNISSILERLEGSGAEVVSGEDDPQIASLFYIARINSKLDNLGQLRHLYRTEKHLNRIADATDEQGRQALIESMRQGVVDQQKMSAYNALTSAMKQPKIFTEAQVCTFPFRFILEFYRKNANLSDELYEEYFPYTYLDS